MGFMDKAKKMAEQAQSKLDEVQKQFNENQASSQAPPTGAGGDPIEYDEHGRPLPAEEAAAPPHGDPVDTSTPPPPPPPAPPTAGPPQPPASAQDEHAPPKLSSGDPLEG
jgi:hypothetical protein